MKGFIDLKESRKRAREKAKENLDDSYIVKVITRGSKLKPAEVPSELITLKRLALQMKKAVDRLEKGVVLHCRTHGQLIAEDCIKKGKSPAGAILYRCRACMKITHQKNYQRNKERLLKKAALYREQNKEKIQEIRREYKKKIQLDPEKEFEFKKYNRMRGKKYRELNRETIRKRESEWKRKTVELLTDTYIKRLISERENIPRDQIAREMIERKRHELKQKRALKQLEFKLNQEEDSHVK